MDEGRNMAEIKLKKRRDGSGVLQDLSSLFGSDEEFEKTEQELAKKIRSVPRKTGNNERECRSAV